MRDPLGPQPELITLIKAFKKSWSPCPFISIGGSSGIAMPEEDTGTGTASHPGPLRQLAIWTQGISLESVTLRSTEGVSNPGGRRRSCVNGMCVRQGLAPLTLEASDDP